MSGNESEMKYILSVICFRMADLLLSFKSLITWFSVYFVKHY